MNTPLVSIGIPTYNRARAYLRLALESALSQTYDNIEVIVSDNCSIDGTGEVISSFVDRRIRYYRQEVNIGANNNFNFCLEQAKGKYFLLLHDDDLLDRDFVEACMMEADYREDIGVIRSGTRIIDAHGAVMREYPNMVAGVSNDDFLLGWFSGKTALYLCSTLYNAAGLRDIGGFRSPKNLFQDAIATVQLAARSGRADVCDVKASFRRHAYNRGSAVKVDDWRDDSLYLMDIICSLASENQALIRCEGMKFLCKKNYRQLASIESSFEQFRAYFGIYRGFDYCYSPLRYLLVRPLVGGIKSKMRHLTRVIASSVLP